MSAEVLRAAMGKRRVVEVRIYRCGAVSELLRLTWFDGEWWVAKRPLASPADYMMKRHEAEVAAAFLLGHPDARVYSRIRATSEPAQQIDRSAQNNP